MSWWILTSLASAATLDDAVAAADATFPGVTAASLQAERAEATAGKARAALLPKVVVAASQTVNDQAVQLDLGGVLPPAVIALTGPIDPVTVQPKAWSQASATLVVPLVDVDGWATLVAAGRAATAADADAAAARLAVRLGVARAFYGARLARAGVAVADEAVALAARDAAAAQARVDVGAAPARVALDAERARLAAVEARARAAADAATAEAALHRLTGLDPNVALEDGPAPAAPGSLEAALAALDRRPELQAADARIAAAQAASRAADLAWVPDLSARGTALYTGNQGFAPDGKFLVGVVEATWTFDGGYRAAAARDAHLAAAQADAGARAARREAEEQVRVAWARLEGARAGLVAAREQERAAAAAQAAAQAAFDAGAAPFVDLERANVGLSAARLARIRGELGVAEGAATLAWLSGG